MDDGDSLAHMLQEFSPHVVGLSLRNIDNCDVSDSQGYVNEYRDLARTIRTHSSALLVLGGSGFSLFPEELMELLGADYGIVGEGERFKQLLENIDAHREPGGLPGVVLPGNPGVVPVPWSGTMERGFSAHWDGLGFYLKRGGMLNLQTKRGCNFKCIYCTYPHIEGKAFRFVSPENVAAEAVEIERAGAKFFFVTDSAFNGDYGHSAQVARAFIRSGLSIPWGAFFAPTTPPNDYYEILADAGLTHVEFGTESLTDPVLSRYRKPFQWRHIRASHEAALDAGLHVAHYLLLGGPGEDALSIKKTLDRAERLEGAVLFFFCGMRIYPHTALYTKAVESGRISPNQSLLKPVYYQPSGISHREIMELVEKRAADKPNWIIGSGGKRMTRVIQRMYQRGHFGPLWEYLIR